MSGWLVVQQMMEERSRLLRWRDAGTFLTQHQQAMVSALCEAEDNDSVLTMFRALLANGPGD